MTSDQRIGLVCAGSAGRTFVSHLPSLKARLGPIKAASFSVARRFARSFGAGYPVQPYSALELCPLICVIAPEAQLGALETGMVEGMPLAGARILVCGCDRDSVSFHRLASRGARIATLTPADDDDLSALWIIEGDARIVARVNRWFKRDKLSLVEILPGTKPLFVAGKQMVDELLVPWATASAACFRAAGIGARQAAQIVQHLGERRLRAQKGVGTPVVSALLQEKLRRMLEEIAPVLETENPRLAAIYINALETALAYYSGGEIPRLSKGPGKVEMERLARAFGQSS